MEQVRFGNTVSLEDAETRLSTNLTVPFFFKDINRVHLLSFSSSSSCSPLPLHNRRLQTVNQSYAALCSSFEYFCMDNRLMLEFLKDHKKKVGL